MKRIIFFFFATVCAFAAQKEEQVTGSWYCGDGTGYNVRLEIRVGGQYEATWQGCLGEYGSAKGTWSTGEDRIVLSPSEEKDMMKGHLTVLLVIVEGNVVTLLRQQDAANRDNPFFRFRKEEKAKAKDPNKPALTTPGSAAPQRV